MHILSSNFQISKNEFKQRLIKNFFAFTKQSSIKISFNFFLNFIFSSIFAKFALTKQTFVDVSHNVIRNHEFFINFSKFVSTKSIFINVSFKIVSDSQSFKFFLKRSRSIVKPSEMIKKICDFEIFFVIFWIVFSNITFEFQHQRRMLIIVYCKKQSKRKKSKLMKNRSNTIQMLFQKMMMMMMSTNRIFRSKKYWINRKFVFVFWIQKMIIHVIKKCRQWIYDFNTNCKWRFVYSWIEKLIKQYFRSRTQLKNL